jgi:ribonuclease HI
MPTRTTGPLTIATDGSVGHLRGAAVAGTAWIAADGSYGVDVVPTRVPLVAELAALHRAITAHDARQPLHVLTDCQDAVDALATVVTTRSVPTPAGVPGASRIAQLLRLVTVELRRRPVQITWVRGHDGHQLNELADRLCVQARRWVQYGGRLEDARPLTDRIAAEFTPAVPLAS